MNKAVVWVAAPAGAALWLTVLGFTFIRGTRGSSDTAPKPASKSSFLAKANVACSPAVFTSDAHCSVSMHGGHGSVCWTIVRECDGSSRTARRCSGAMDRNTTASFTISGAEFTPPVTTEMSCAAFRVSETEIER